MIIARSYQTEAVTSIWDYFRRAAGNPIVAMPTGTGKSVVIALFLQSVLQAYPAQRVMVLTHVKELISQNYQKLMTIWPFAPAGVYSAGLNRRDAYCPITFAGIGSVAKRAALFGHIDLVIIDECHLISPNDATMYQLFFSALRAVNPYVKFIGFTATPWRMGHGKLTDAISGPKGEEVPSLFTDFAFDITGVHAFNRLIAEGFLAPLVPKRPQMLLDVDGVHLRGGEFIQAELQRAVNKQDLTERAVREAMELGEARLSWLAFTAGVEHAVDTAEIMNTLGVPAIAIHSKMGDKERDRAVAAFKAGEYRCAVNNNILTTGFDHPPVDLILGLRPTQSAPLWVQMLGRGTRPYDPAKPGEVDPGVFWAKKENCLVLDFAGNTKRLGPINDPVVPRKKGKKGGDAPVKECPVCATWVHASLRFCDGIKANGDACNHEFVFDTKLKQGASQDELIKGDMPVVEVFKVDHITYAEHTKMGRAPMVRVTYYCGLRSFSEYVCPQHTDFARVKAVRWWKLRSNEEMPDTTERFLEVVGELPAPMHLRVWINKKYPEILAHSFDGSAFGTKEAAPEDVPSVEVQGGNSPDVAQMREGQQAEPAFYGNMDDDIPF